MISRLNVSSLSFSGNNSSVRDDYEAKISGNEKIAQNQTNVAMNPAVIAPIQKNPIPMQGTGQKLDVVA